MMNNTDGNNFQFLAFYCSGFIMCPLSKVEVHLQNSLFLCVSGLGKPKKSFSCEIWRKDMKQQLSDGLSHPLAYPTGRDLG